METREVLRRKLMIYMWSLASERPLSHPKSEFCARDKILAIFAAAISTLALHTFETVHLINRLISSTLGWSVILAY